MVKPMMVTTSSTMPMAEAAPQSKRLILCWMNTAMVVFRGPPSTAGVRKNPSARTKTRSVPATSAPFVTGKNTRRNACHAVAPRLFAATVRLGSTPAIDA